MARGREGQRKEGSEEQTGRLRRLEVDAEGLLGQRMDPYLAEDRACLKAQRWQSAGVEEIAQD